MRIKNFALTYPAYLTNFSLIFSSGVKRAIIFFSSFTKLLKERSFRRNESPEFKTGQEYPRKLSSGRFMKLLKPLVITIIVIILLIGGIRVLGKFGSASSEASKFEVKGAKASQNVDKEFSFPLKNDEGDQVGEVKYLIEKSELLDEILVDGKKATAVKGREFLILTLRITNEYKQAVEINTKDYVRLSVNNDKEEWLAPEIHNDPVKVQAISTKPTRLGFPINVSDKNLVLRIGQIDGNKEEIVLNLK